MQKRDLARATSPTAKDYCVPTEDSLVVEGSRKRKSVRYLSPSTLYGPPPGKFRKISDAPFTESRAESASASSDSPRAHEDLSTAANASSARNVQKVIELQRSLLGSIKSWFGF
ncbi:hypothetical protein K525DRAFT_274866 [Schizophyllum commune Loenen D]|nr:hypothetical protein K525DRAFT_274866 [Schizophyllum commune Loenen D]